VRLPSSRIAAAIAAWSKPESTEPLIRTAQPLGTPIDSLAAAPAPTIETWLGTDLLNTRRSAYPPR
jgi:hypothetical protein